MRAVAQNGDVWTTQAGNGTLGQRDEGHPGFFRLLMVGIFYVFYHRLHIFPKCNTIMYSHRIFIVVSKNHSIIIYTYIYIYM